MARLAVPLASLIFRAVAFRGDQVLALATNSQRESSSGSPLPSGSKASGMSISGGSNPLPAGDLCVQAGGLLPQSGSSCAGLVERFGSTLAASAAAARHSSSYSATRCASVPSKKLSHAVSAIWRNRSGCRAASESISVCLVPVSACHRSARDSVAFSGVDGRPYSWTWPGVARRGAARTQALTG